MKIKKIEIENFRSIREYGFNVSDFNVFVGQNNHGKTNLFEALNWFDSGKVEDKDYFDYIKTNTIKVRVYFSGVQKALDELESEKYKNTLKNKIGTEDDIYVEKTSKDNKREVFVNGVSVGNPTGFDSALNYFLPKIEYVTTSIRLGDISGYKSKSPIGEMLSGVLSDVIAHDPRSKDFIEKFNELFNGEDSLFRKQVGDLESRVETYLKKQFSEGTSIDFKIDNPKFEDMLKGFETYVDDGVRTKADQKGDGMKRAIMLAILQSYADFRKEKNIARNFVFLIDEAELHLHPSAQRSLKKALREIVDNGGQVFINTHSSIFANENYDNQKIFSITKEGKESDIHEIKTKQEQLDSIYKLLGGSPADLLLPSNFIIVEGQTENAFLEKIIERFYSDNSKCNNIKVIFARGDSVKQSGIYHAVHECYTPLLTNGVYRDRVVFLFDLPNIDQKSNFDLFKAKHKNLKENEHLYILPVEDIEEYYPGTWKKNKSEISDADKVYYSISVAEAITFNEFKNDMPVVYEMLEKAIEKGYE